MDTKYQQDPVVLTFLHLGTVTKRHIYGVCNVTNASFSSLAVTKRNIYGVCNDTKNGMRSFLPKAFYEKELMTTFFH